MKHSLLQYGNIPANTECPFKGKCSVVYSCWHRGVKHENEFSCAMARAFDLTRNDTGVENVKQS